MPEMFLPRADRPLPRARRLNYQSSTLDGCLFRRQRETDVARLLAEGLTNKETGTRLFISERTVESHVRNILNKLGFNSGAQIAGWMASSDR